MTAARGADRGRWPLDFGYQLLRHVVWQVFGNLGQAAQLTITPLVMSLILSAVIGFVWVLFMSAATPASSALVVLGGSGAAIIGLIIAVMYCWAAVGWHRFVLLSETGDGLFPPWSLRTVRLYLGRSVLIALIIAVALFGAFFLFGTLVTIVPALHSSPLPGIALSFLISWLLVRFGLVLPAAALARRLSLLESWRLTRPVSGHVLLPIITFALVFAVLGQVNLRVFAADPVSGGLLFRFGTDGAHVGLAGLAVAAVLFWVQLILNLALLTTLYGNLVEGRALN